MQKSEEKVAPTLTFVCFQKIGLVYIRVPVGARAASKLLLGAGDACKLCGSESATLMKISVVDPKPFCHGSGFDFS
jgi:hypothetical protein